MARQASVEVVNSFVQGLVTEATGLNFPENACIETENCKFDNKGVVSRRLGIDYEASYSSFVSTRDSSAMTEYVWNAVAGDGNKTFVVVQIGGTIYFYEEDADGPLSPGKESFTIALADYDIASNPGVGGVACQFSSGKGYLFITHPYCDPIYVTYSAGGDTVTGAAITVKIRDFEGLPPTATYPDFTTRPTSTRAALDDFDEYNLLNQGWGQTVQADAGGNVVALDDWDSGLTTMPALGDGPWWKYKDANDQFNTGYVGRMGTPNWRAPYGYYILNAFLQERDVVSGISGLSNDDITAGYMRPKCCAFYAGRAWYGGVDAAGFGSKLYFTQIIEADDQLGKCYQLNDPTSEESFDLLPSDGGVISIPDMATLHKMFVMGSTLLLFASNGVWAVSGSSTDGLGFAANDYTVRKLSSVGSISGLSFVDIEGTPGWWNYEGIWTIQADQVGSLTVQSLSKTTIQSVFDQVPTENKLYAKGAYNRTDRIVQWVYRQATAGSTDNNYNYDHILNLNVQTGAFYPWTLDISASVRINGIVATKGSTTTEVVADITDSAVQVTVDGEDVEATVSASVVFANRFRYLTTKNTSGTSYTTTWSEERDTTYMDWDTPGTAVDYDSYLVTGYSIQGQAQRFFQSNYVVVFFEQQANSSCFFQSIWDYATSGSSRVSPAQQVVRAKTNVGVQMSRVKARGKGRAIQFKFYSEAGKPFRLIGWSKWNTVNSNV